MDASAGIVNIFSIHSNGGCALLGQLNKSKYILDLFEIIAHLQELEGIHLKVRTVQSAVVQTWDLHF